MIKLPAIDFHCHGQVAQDELREIRNTLEECYPRLGRWLPERVEIQLFETPVQLATFLEVEKAALGIKTLGDEAFICSHDAWHGYPRLLICTERLFVLPPMARWGALRHEAAHTVVHGALVYYVFRLPHDCVELAQAKGMGLPLLQQVLYHCATAVKDFEVTKLLLNQGYRECQLAFAQTQFLLSEEDKLAWRLAGHHPQGRLLFFTGQLKTLLLGWPLEVAGLMQLGKYTDSMLSYVETDGRKQLLGLAVGIAEELGDDTHSNVRLALQRVLQELL